MKAKENSRCNNLIFYFIFLLIFEKYKKYQKYKKFKNIFLIYLRRSWHFQHILKRVSIIEYTYIYIYIGIIIGLF